MNKTDDRLRKLLRPDVPPGGKPARQKKTTEVSIDLSRLEEMSESELVVLAHEMGYETASRQLLREDLIDLVLGMRTEPEDPVQPIREKTWAFVRGNRSMMPSSMPCNLDCLHCPARTVVECYSDNHSIVD